jgi:drug/metabolite transporter (DMT)-like permease
MNIFEALKSFFENLPTNIKGGLWMICAGVFFTFIGVMIRFANKEVHVLEIVFFRYFISLLIMMPWMMRTGLSGLSCKNLPLLFARSISSYIGAIFWFASMIYLPLAEAPVLGYTAPLFATLGAVLFLGEVVRKKRWWALVVGFSGTLIILRPGIETITLPALYAIGGAIFISCSALLVKVLSRTDSPETIVLYMAIFSTPLSLGAAIFVWSTPSLETLFWLIGIGLFSTLAHLAYTRSFAIADASVVLPYDYVRLLMVAAVGFGFFGEIPDIWTWAGAAVIAGSTFYIARRETTSTGKNKIISKSTRSSVEFN